MRKLAAIQDLAQALIRLNGGYQRYPYESVTGKRIVIRGKKINIGYGRDLTTVGIEEHEARDMLAGEVRTITGILTTKNMFGDCAVISTNRMAALIAFGYSVGVRWLLTMDRLWAKLGDGEFRGAATEVMKSAWAKQHIRRAQRLAGIIRTGEWPKEYADQCSQKR